MKLTSIADSKAATHAGYDPDRKVMRVVYKNTGKHYEHENVEPFQWEAFQSAPSKGAWIQANLGGKNKVAHPFQQVAPLAEDAN